jgi:membrane-associated phospholipid phosphatase
MSKIIQLFFIFIIYSNIAFCNELATQLKSEFLSPVTTEARSVLLIGGGITIFSLFFKEDIKNEIQPDVAEDHPLKKTSTFFELMGRGVPNALYFIAMGSDYLLNNNQKSLSRAKLMLKSSLYAGLVTDASKVIINEKRPNGKKYSFPSGHTTEAFAFASTIAMEHSPIWGISAGILATGVGFSRMNDNAHYLHDVLAGATIGTMYGVGLYYLYNQEAEVTNKANETVGFIAPIPNGIKTSFYTTF